MKFEVGDEVYFRVNNHIYTGVYGGIYGKMTYCGNEVKAGLILFKRDLKQYNLAISDGYYLPKTNLNLNLLKNKMVQDIKAALRDIKENCINRCDFLIF